MAIIMSCSSSVISNLYESEIPSLPSGRKLYRHPTLPGSVIVFNDGIERKVLVLDAQYRVGIKDDFKKWGWNVEVPGIAQIDMNDWSIDSLTGYPDNVTDSTINTKMKDVNTSRDNTTTLVTDYPENHIPVTALYCRSVTIGDNLTCDLPNINTLMRIYLDRQYIDELDPTIDVSDTSSSSNLYRSLNTIWSRNFVWSSSEQSETYAWGITSNGRVSSDYKGSPSCVVPVYEL